jgi:predicted 3-demethylubiquinone-9 3-methyltransferase (glyoxalase superfamily)
VAHNEMATMLMFAGQAEEAIALYTSVFPDSGVDFVERYGPENPDAAGQIVHARFTINGQHVLAMDTAGVQHDFTFTPSTSFFVSCDSESEVDRVFAALSEGGSVLMELGAYPFAKRYVWLQDRFGVSWQLIFR